MFSFISVRISSNEFSSRSVVAVHCMYSSVLRFFPYQSFNVVSVSGLDQIREFQFELNFHLILGVQQPDVANSQFFQRQSKSFSAFRLSLFQCRGALNISFGSGSVIWIMAPARLWIQPSHTYVILIWKTFVFPFLWVQKNEIKRYGIYFRIL